MKNNLFPPRHTDGASNYKSKLNRKRVVTFGTFDLFHFGHLKLLQRAAALGDELFVGVSSDALNVRKKGRAPVMSECERAGIVASLRCVNVVFLEESLEMKREYLLRYEADVLVMGDDWAGRFDGFGDICEVVYLPRTKNISTTELLERIRGDFRGESGGAGFGENAGAGANARGEIDGAGADLGEIAGGGGDDPAT